MSVFVLLPLFAGGTDFVLIMSAQAQLRTALQALDYFAWTNPGNATNMTEAGYIISLINQESDYTVTLPTTLSSGGANGGISYDCFTLPASASMTIPPPQATTCSYANPADPRRHIRSRRALFYLCRCLAFFVTLSVERQRHIQIRS